MTKVGLVPLVELPVSYVPLNSEEDRLGRQSLESIVRNYIHYYASGRSHTARAKRYDLEHFLVFLAGGDPNAVSTLAVSDWSLQRTKDFIDERLERGEAPATVSRRLATLKHFGRTLAERVPGFINPAREAKGPTLQILRPQGLSDEEITFLRTSAEELVAESDQKFPSRRNQLLLELLLACGLRADEVRTLALGQITSDLEWLKNVKTKGRKFRNVYLDTAIRPQLREYLTLRESYLLSFNPNLSSLPASELGRYPLFLSTHRARINEPSSFGMSPKSIWRVIRDIGVRASVIAGKPLPNLHPHKLRHAFAHGLLDSSNDVRLVAQALGHSDIRTTMRYTERTDEEIASAIEKKISTNS